MPCQRRGDVERLSVSNSPLLICAQTLSKLQLFLCCQPNDKLEEAVRDVINKERCSRQLQETRRNSLHNDQNFCPHTRPGSARATKAALYIGSITCSGSQHPILTTSFKSIPGGTWCFRCFLVPSCTSVCVFVPRLCCEVRTRIPIELEQGEHFCDVGTCCPHSFRGLTGGSDLSLNMELNVTFRVRGWHCGCDGPHNDSAAMRAHVCYTYTSKHFLSPRFYSFGSLHGNGYKYVFHIYCSFLFWPQKTWKNIHKWVLLGGDHGYAGI